jgi:crotonobetainyl-CoA:carnitine CoA-transferase CaiB-like acyl-CoA transferase
VVVENFRPGVLERLGLGHEALPLVPDRHAKASGAGAIDRAVHCPGLANHRVPVTTNHLPGGKHKSVPVARLGRTT